MEEGDEHLDADVPDVSNIVVPDALRGIASREVQGNVLHGSVMDAVGFVGSDRSGCCGCRAWRNYQPYAFAYRAENTHCVYLNVPPCVIALSIL